METNERRAIVRLQRQDFFHWRDGAWCAAADDVGQVFSHSQTHQTSPDELGGGETVPALFAQLQGHIVSLPVLADRQGKPTISGSALRSAPRSWSTCHTTTNNLRAIVTMALLAGLLRAKRRYCSFQ